MSEATVAESQSAIPEAPLFWTKEMARLLRKANRISFYFEERTDGTPDWKPQPLKLVFVFEEKKDEGRPYRPEQRLEFRMNGNIRKGYGDQIEIEDSGGHQYHRFSGDADNRYEPATGTWTFSLYHRDPTTTETALLLLPVGAEVVFEVALDFSRNSYSTKARVHCDSLLATFKKGKVRGTLEIDSTIVEHNTARFGYGIGR